MHSFNVTGPNCAANLHLLEIKIQCDIAKRIFPRLQEWALLETQQLHTPPGPHPIGSLQVFAECSILLSACSVVSNILFYGHSLSEVALEKKDPRIQRAARRAGELRERLQIPDLPTLRNLAVRNSFEHIDERIDKLIASDPDGPFVWLHTSRHEPTAPLVLKRFNPNTMTLHYMEEGFDLVACRDELLTVERIAEAALRGADGA